MSSNQQNLLEMAKQGNPEAIIALMNRSLQPKGVTAKASLKGGCLQVMLVSDTVPNQTALSKFVIKGISSLKIDSITTLVIFGKRTGENIPAWTRKLQLQPIKEMLPRESERPVSPVLRQSIASDSRENLPIHHRKQSRKINHSDSATKRQNQKLAWYETDSPVLIVGLLLIFFPAGLWSMWKYAQWSAQTKGIISGIAALIFLLSIRGEPHQSTSVSQPVNSTDTALAAANSTPEKKDLAGVPISVEVPQHPACSREYVSVALDTFDSCLLEGMTYYQVASTIGYRGTLQAKSGDTEIWQWNAGTGKYLSATFSKSKLTGKSQIDLDPSIE